MGCTLECPGDNACPANSDCSGHQPTCGSNLTSWGESIVAKVTVVKSSHVTELQNAITAERNHPTRRGVSLACATNCSDSPVFTRVPIASDVVLANDFNEVASANNTTEYNVNCPSDTGAAEAPAAISPNVSVSGIIYKADLDKLRSDINDIEFSCICNAFCNCDINCGNNAECPLDGVPYY